MKAPFFCVKELCYLDNGPYDFTVPAHGVMGLSGASGVGKTQLLRALVEAIPYEGKIHFNGSAVQSFSPANWRKTIGLVPAESVWWRELVGEHLPNEEDTVRRDSLLTGLGFTADIASWRIDRLSTGERQRLALVRALMLEPSVMLLDEPCSALDDKATALVENLLLQYVKNRQAALIWVSHDAEQLQRVADCCYHVHRNHLEMLWRPACV